MKNYPFVYFLSLIVSACSFPNLSEMAFYDIQPLTKSNDDINVDYTVKERDLSAYLNYKRLIGLFNDPDPEITPVFKDGVLVYYIINYLEGWEILSADKRTPIVLASSCSGNYYPKNSIDAEQEWFDDMADDIITMKERLLKEDYSFSDEVKEKMANSVSFWYAINADPLFISGGVETKVDPGNGMWVLDTLIHEEEVDIDVEHYISTSWHQFPPYNNYCPYIQLGLPERAPAGCIAIAGAQMLRYLHYYLGQPVYGPTYASCEMEIETTPPPVITTGGSSYTVWNYMLDDASGFDYDTAAVLVADVAQKTEMEFHANSSASTVFKLRVCLNQYGIESEQIAYNTDTIKNNLLRALPVIVSGKRINASSGHVFIVDGIKISRQKDTFHYIWVPSGPSMNPIPMDRYIIHRSNDSVVYRINWGWTNQYNRFTDYASSADWEGYSTNKSIVKGFRSTN